MIRPGDINNVRIVNKYYRDLNQGNNQNQNQNRYGKVEIPPTPQTTHAEIETSNLPNRPHLPKKTKNNLENTTSNGRI